MRCARLPGLRSAQDHIVEPVNARTVLEGVGSAQITGTILAESFHVATVDHDAPATFPDEYRVRGAGSARACGETGVAMRMCR
ncbi:MAG: hypothetical protein ACRDQ5_20005 [Sciscionella sp.]